MKNNLPITDKEVILNDSSVITSTTDLKGAVTYVNQDFMEISGYSRDELMGKNHNIVRHPDMPPAAFADLWTTLKAGKPWMGLVKNRCKSGDFYWVDAFVTPRIKNGEITGYESTRVKPIKALTDRAEALYKKISAGEKLKLKSLGFLQKQILTATVFQFLVFASLAVTKILSLPIAITAWIAICLSWAGISYYQMRDFQKLLKRSKNVIDNKIMQLAYYGKVDDVSQIRLSIRMLVAKLRTVIKRIEQSTEQLSAHAQESSEIVIASNINITQQNQELETVDVFQRNTRSTCHSSKRIFRNVNRQFRLQRYSLVQTA